MTGELMPAEGGALEQEQEYRYSDDQLVALIDQEIEAAVTAGDDFDEALAEAEDYYYGELPEAAGPNTSDYVSLEVMDSVESMKAKLYKTFAGSRDIVRFKPISEEDVEGARLRTQYVKRVLFRDNPGEVILHDLFHDLCMARIGCIKRYAKTERVIEWLPFENQPYEVVEASAMQAGITKVEITSEQYMDSIVQTPMGPAQTRQRIVSGRAKQVTERTKICVEVINPRDVRIFRGVTDITDTDAMPGVALLLKKRRYELIAEGFDPEVVAELSAGSRDLQDVGRRGSVSQTWAGTTSGISSLDEIDIEEAYVRLDMETPDDEPEGLAEVWQIIKSGTTILSKKRVDEIPLRFASAYRIAHEAIGLSVADVAIETQRGTTNVTRGVMDNVHRVNAGLRAVDMKRVRNPRDLIDNPIGGIVDTDDPNAFAVVPQPAVSAATLPLLEILASQKEQRTGDTRLGRGLNTGDVITHQNAKDMIDQLIEVGNARPMMMASLIASTCIQPLMLDIWRLGLEYDVPALLERDGKLQEVRPSQLPPGDEMQVDYALTPEYGQKRAQNTLMLHQLMMSNPTLSPLYQLEEQYAAIAEVTDLLGQPNWLANPKDQKVAQRIQMAQQAAQQQAQAQQQMMQAQMAQQNQIQQAQLGKMMAEVQSLIGQLKLKKEALDLDAAQGAAQQALAEREFQHQKAVDKAEIEIEKEQARQTRIGDDD